jgi:hypothetical protein
MLPYLGPEIIKYLLTRSGLSQADLEVPSEEKPSDCGHEAPEIADTIPADPSLRGLRAAWRRDRQRKERA